MAAAAVTSRRWPPLLPPHLTQDLGPLAPRILRRRRPSQNPADGRPAVGSIGRRSARIAYCGLFALSMLRSSSSCHSSAGMLDTGCPRACLDARLVQHKRPQFLIDPKSLIPSFDLCSFLQEKVILPICLYYFCLVFLVVDLYGSLS